MMAFEDNLKNARMHASREQVQVYEQEYADFMEALPKKRRRSDENKGIEHIEMDIANLQLNMGKLQTQQAERKASLKDIKRKRKFRILWLILAVCGTLATLYITYRLLTDARSFSTLLFEFIISLFIMVVFWMIFNFYQSGDMKKSRMAYLTNICAELTDRINVTEYELNELKQRREALLNRPGAQNEAEKTLDSVNI